MKPYPRNDISYKISTPMYKSNTLNSNSRYSIYREIDNLPRVALEIKLTNSISTNVTYMGYYYTTTKKETLFEISKKYYNSESFWWIIAKANNLKDNGVSILNKGITLLIPLFSELYNTGGYFTMKR